LILAQDERWRYA